MRRRRVSARSARMTACLEQEIRKDLLAVGSADGLGMELHAMHRPLTMANGHDDAIGFGRHLEAWRKGVRVTHQRMIAHGLELARDAVEQGVAEMRNQAALAVHHPGSADNSASERVDDALVAEADAENWDALTKLKDHLKANAEIGRVLRPPGPR